MRTSAAGGDVPGALLDEGGLCRGKSRQGNSIRRATDVVQPQLVAERDACGLTAVLAADAELDLFLRRAAALDRDSHQVSDSALVERLERVALEHAVLEVAGQELALGIVPRQPERRLGQVIGAEGEKVGVRG